MSNTLVGPSLPPISSLPLSPQGAVTPASSSQTVVANASALGPFISFPKIEMLRNDNWFAWKTRIAAVLKMRQAYEIVTRAVPQPKDPVAAANWEEKDLFAQALIATVIDDEQIVHILGCNTSAEMWEALRTIHEPRGEESIFLLKRAFYTAQAKEGSDIAVHLSDMKVLRERLALAGYWVDDDHFKALLLASLPCSWEPFATSWHQRAAQGNQDAELMTVQQLISLLREEGQRRKEKKKEANLFMRRRTTFKRGKYVPNRHHKVGKRQLFQKFVD